MIGLTYPLQPVLRCIYVERWGAIQNDGCVPCGTPCQAKTIPGQPVCLAHYHTVKENRRLLAPLLELTSA